MLSGIPSDIVANLNNNAEGTMIFDSFYVSLLSEKYKSGNNFSLKGLWVGLMSNLSAVKTKEYSSLIYCFKKG